VGAGLAYGLAGLAILGFAWSLRYYDGSEFLGLRQWRARQRSALDQERLHLSPLHRFVRHPWYTLGLVLVWTQNMDAARLTSAVVISAYFVLGSRLEERKLLLYHGPAYAAYRRRVPALLPRPWRSLSSAEARELTRLSRLQDSDSAGS
jgi:protein-S-isoprenylcysteine O-methyltransferase Ste14